jgi:glycosyltransferase involved in cell wall biosynthesis
VSRILFVESWTALGGGQRLMLDLVEHLAGRGHTCAVAFPGTGPVRDLLEQRNVETFEYALPVLPAGSKTLLDRARFLTGARRSAASLSEIGRRFGADLLFSMGGRPALTAALAARRLDVPMVCSVQLIYRGAERRLLGWCFGRREVASVTFCSRSAAAPFGQLDGKATLVPNWVSPAFLDAPLRCRVDPESIVVGVLGRISHTKGQRLFLEALLPLLEEDPRLRLAIGGGSDFEDPSEERVLGRLIEQSGQADRVLFGGAVDALAFLDSLDVLVVPSLWEEPFGLVAVEGMARALPVVATRSGALPEIVDHGTTGFVVGRNPPELSAAVARLAGDPELRRAMGETGRRRAEDLFGPARQLPVVATLVERALAA